MPDRDAISDANISTSDCVLPPRIAKRALLMSFIISRPAFRKLAVNTTSALRKALADALKSGHLRGAAVDVFKDEPKLRGCPLLGLENVILTPHSSALSPQVMVRSVEYTMENLLRVFDGQEPLRIVN